MIWGFPGECGSTEDVAMRMVMWTGGGVWLGGRLCGRVGVVGRTTLRDADRGCAGRHTLGGQGQRCGELIANCD